jgi:hypothetical protein
MLSPEIIESLFLGGQSLADIGRSYGLSRERVRQILAEGGQTASSLQSKADDARRGKVEPLAAQGLARFEIADRVGLTICQVDRICRMFEIKTVHKKS